jgi:hypothetical protein
MERKIREKGYWRQYKEKECPVCFIKHKGRALICSRKCSEIASPRKGARALGNYTQEEWSQKNKESHKHWKNNPEVSSHLNIIRNTKKGEITREDFSIQIPDIHEFPEGYDKAEDW